MSTAAATPAPPPRPETSTCPDGGGELLRKGIGAGAAWLLVRFLRDRTHLEGERPDRSKGDAGSWEGTLSRLERGVGRRVAGSAGVSRGRRPGAGPRAAEGLPAGARRRVQEGVARQVFQGASALSFSILADSAAEHYRGRFHNPAMFAAPAMSALTLLASTRRAIHPHLAGHRQDATFGAAVLTGLAGVGFHACHISRRIGGWSWENLFYGPPVAAPLGLTAAGLLGLAATLLAGGGSSPPLLLGMPAGRVLTVGAAVGLLGTAGEAGVLHFRGAFHHPAMYVPVTVPPLAALALAAVAFHPTPARRRLARVLLRATSAAGFVGVGFHARGIRRSMGGWRNWSQNLLAGPPLPAPPAFTGMALAGLAGLSLLEGEVR